MQNNLKFLEIIILNINFNKTAFSNINGNLFAAKLSS